MPPIVNQTSDVFHDPTTLSPGPDPLKTKGRLMLATGTIANAATDLAGSKYKLCELPSACYLHESTFFDVQGDGFAQIQIGTRDDAVALVDQTRATENIVTPIAMGDGNHGLELWQILGLAEDPCGFIPIFKHAAANATGAGATPFRIAYIWR